MNTDIEVITLRKDNIQDFASVRNDLLAKAKKEWVLFVDTDEEVSSRQFPVSNEFSGYRIARKNYFQGRYVGTDWIVRLGKKGAGRWERRVHETWKIEGKVGRIDNPFIMHNTAKKLSDYIIKIDFYSTLHAEANREEGKASSIFKIIFFPLGKFVATLIKSRSVVFSIMQAFHSYLSWSKLYFLRS